jgi:hypothetical protein
MSPRIAFFNSKINLPSSLQPAPLVYYSP